MAVPERLTEAEIEAALALLPEWEREDEKWIRRAYRFASFREAMAFVQGVADLAEAANHHPFIAIDYRKVTLRLTTWHAGGLTALDSALAADCDKAYEKFRDRPDRG